MAHGTDNDTGDNIKFLFSPVKSPAHSQGDLLHAEPFVGVKYGSKTDLQVADILSSRVFRKLKGNSLKGLLVLHHRGRNLKCLEILCQ